MNDIVSKIMVSGGLLILVLISGVVLSSLGHPLNTLFFTIHKLSAVGALIVLVINISKLSKIVDLSTLSMIGMAATGLLFLALIVSGVLISLVAGGILDLNAPALQSVLKVHQIAPWLATVSLTLSIYLMAGSEIFGWMGAMR